MNVAPTAFVPGQSMPAAPDGLASLLIPLTPLTPQCAVRKAAEVFLDDRVANLLSLPVVDARGIPLGSISRHELMLRVYMQAYGRELHGRRAVTTLMNPSPLTMARDTRIDVAGQQIGARIRSPITEDFIIVDADGRYLGVGLVLDVLRALEVQLARRSEELEGAYRRLKSSQGQLVQSEKLATLGQLVAGLAHEINTPLGYVRNNVEMTRELLPAASALLQAQGLLLDAADGGAADDQLAALSTRARAARAACDPAVFDDLQGLLDDTVHGVAQIAELVGSLKDYSRLDHERSDDVDVHGLVESALRIVSHLLRRRGADVQRHFGDIPRIRCAPAQINQVLLNLLTNATQAIDESGGRIVVRTQCMGGHVLIAVEDDGRGIPADVLPRIFEPFFTTKPTGQGTGLGLSICQQIVQAHGGRIGATSKPSVGTRFVVMLPIATPAQVAR